MPAIRSVHSRVFTQLVAARRQTLVEAITSGSCDFERTYWKLLGEIQGLDDALKLSEQTDFKLSGDEPDVRA